MNCPCGSNENYENCCQPFIAGEAFPKTAEALMRSRYTAHVTGDIPYLKRTLTPESRASFDPAATKQWAQAEWLGLNILAVKKGGEGDKKGTVEFTAAYKQGGKNYEHHEVSRFRKDSRGRWLFADGDAHVHEEGQGHHHGHETPEPAAAPAPKVGRNEPCVCGSGKKYKHCCEGE